VYNDLAYTAARELTKRELVTHAHARAVPPTFPDDPKQAPTHQDLETYSHSFLFQRDADTWLIRFGNERSSFAITGNKGLQHLQDLLSRPYRFQTGLQLISPHNACGQPEHSVQKIVDDAALEDYRRQAEDLMHRIEDARRNNDQAAEKLQCDLAILIEQLERDRGLGVRTRGLGPASPEVRAFHAVRRNIKRVVKKLERKLPTFAAHLNVTIKDQLPGFAYTPSYDPLYPSLDWYF
jgi:hypothetical protein